MTNLQQQPLDEATFHMEELINEIEFYHLGMNAVVSEDADLKLGLEHGFAYLTGNAAGLIQSSAFDIAHDIDYTVADWEQDIVSAINMLLLAVVQRRLESGALVEGEDDDTGPSGAPAFAPFPLGGDGMVFAFPVSVIPINANRQA